MNQKGSIMKRHFEEKNGECTACLKYSVIVVVEKKYKMQHLEGSGTPVLYIGRTVLKGYGVMVERYDKMKKCQRQCTTG